MKKKTNHLGLFAKYWEPGKVKTRLAASIGADAACSIYKLFFDHLTKNLESSGDDRTVVYSPPDKQADFESAVGPWSLVPQSDGDLGARLTGFFQNVLTGEESLVVIGSDCLQIDAALIERAFAQLQEADVVLSPSHDGGYCLVGMSKFVPEAFEDIAWSSEAVFDQTVQKLDQANATYHVFEPLNDIDDINDLNDFCDNFASTELRTRIRDLLPTS